MRSRDEPPSVPLAASDSAASDSTVAKKNIAENTGHGTQDSGELAEAQAEDILQQVLASLETLGADDGDGAQAISDGALFALVEVFSDVLRPVVDSSESAVDFVTDLWAADVESPEGLQPAEQTGAEGA